MKYLYFSIICMIFVMCKKDDDDFNWGEANATLNGMTWQAETYSSSAPAYPDHIGINLNVYNDNRFLRQTLSFHKVEIRKGVYDLGRVINPHDYSYIGTAFSTILDDGDVLGDIYILDTLSMGNYFEVLNYSESKKEIEVKFSATFLLDRKANANASDSLKFEDGYIKTRINN